MSYTAAEKSNAIILIGEYGAAKISIALYEDLERFGLINANRKDNIITGATLTYDGKEYFRKLKKTDEYQLITQQDFSQAFNGIAFHFKRVHFIDNSACYRVSFNNNGSVTHFKMYNNEEGIWMIETTPLPAWVQEMEMEFSTTIIQHQKDQYKKNP